MVLLRFYSGITAVLVNWHRGFVGKASANPDRLIFSGLLPLTTEFVLFLVGHTF